MAKKLSRIIARGSAGKEEGFVLATSLLLLMLLSMLAVGVVYSAKVSQQTSAMARENAEAFYYAETGINYIAWALKNDAEFDSYAPVVKRLPANGVASCKPKGVFCEPTLPSGAAAASTVGDRYELFADLADPGPRVISDDPSTAGTTGQVMYFDNTPLAGRAVCWGGTPGCQKNAGTPVFDGINKKLPRYIMLTIDTSGKIMPTIPALLPASPHHGTVVGTDIPKNGAIVWITAGTLDPKKDEDGAILPLSSCSGAVPAGQSCYQGASATSPKAVNSYKIVAYAIGYVDGRALRMIRAVIM